MTVSTHSISLFSVIMLNRLFVAGVTAQQSSDGDAKSEKVDAGNQYLWRMSRRKLEAEAVRDSVLQLAGKLDPTMYGRSVDLFAAPFPARRSLYAKIDRQDKWWKIKKKIFGFFSGALGLVKFVIWLAVVFGGIFAAIYFFPSIWNFAANKINESQATSGTGKPADKPAESPAK